MQTNSERSRFATLIRLGLPQSRNFGLGLFVAGLQALSVIALMASSAWLISRAAQMPPVMYLMVAVVLVRAFALGRATFRYGERLLLHDASFRMLGVLRPKLLAKLIPLTPTGLGKVNRGEFLSRIVADVDELQNLTLRVITPVLQSAVALAATLTVFGLLLPTTVPTMLLLAGLGSVTAYFVTGRMARGATAAANSARAKLAKQTHARIELAQLYSAYEWSVQAEADLARTEAELAGFGNRGALSAGLGQSGIVLLSGLATAVVTWQAAQSVWQGELAPVLLAVFALTPIAVFDLLLAANQASLSWQKYNASATRLEQILTSDVPPELPSDGLGRPDSQRITSVSLRGASAKYPSSTVEISLPELHIAAGETLLLTGPSGTGKTTVAMVMQGFLKLARGQFLINNSPSSELDPAAFRRRVAYLEQTPVILLGSLAANLRVAKPAATDEELWQVLERVGLSQTFSNREGLDTQLGETGEAVSGGEAQRIALARALLSEANLLIFDEPTANLDAGTAELLMRDVLSMSNRDANRLVIVITHDPTVLKSGHPIVNLESMGGK